jgi:hypothetical protein
MGNGHWLNKPLQAPKCGSKAALKNESAGKTAPGSMLLAAKLSGTISDLNTGRDHLF